MLPSKRQTSGFDISEVGVIDNLAARSTDCDLSNLPDSYPGVSKRDWYPPQLSLVIEFWISRSKAIGQTCAEPTARDSYCILRHDVQRLHATILLFHGPDLHAVS